MVWCGTRIWWSDLGRIWLTVVEFWSGVVIYSGGLSEENGLVWSEYWKLKRWEAELIVVNGSIREKKGFMHKKISMCNQMVTSEIRELFHVRFVQIQIIYWIFRRGKLLGFGQNAREIIP